MNSIKEAETTEPQLTESEVAEIERKAQLILPDDSEVFLLIRDWRALRAQLSVATDLCNVATESLQKSEAENAALREQLAQVEKERDDFERMALALSAQLASELRG